MEKAMDKSKGFIGVPKKIDIPQVCGKCHTGEVEKYSGSIHGKKTLEGDTHIAQCITCHSVHDIKPVGDPASPVYTLNVPKTCNSCHGDPNFMKKYNPALPVDQYEKYLTSVHGIKHKSGDKNVAQCASCHTSHDIKSANDPKSSVYAVNIPNTCAKCHSDEKLMSQYKIQSDQFDNFSKSVHGMALLEKKDTGAPACNDCHGNHGATPPGVESIADICGICHVNNAELFNKSPHKKAFATKNIPECMECHGNHKILKPTTSMLGVDEGATCMKCHTSQDNTKGYETAKKMRILLDSLNVSFNFADSLIDEAEQKGMEISEAKYGLKDVKQSIIESQTMIHSFNLEKFRSSIDKGTTIVKKISNEGKSAIDEFYFRRKGLGVITLIITLLCVALYFKIREMEKK
jgi:hypothetical protein